MNILVIDDEPLFLERLCSRLQRRGFTVKSASDGKAGVDLFLQNPEQTDVILTDVKMPGLDGIGLLKKIRDHDYDTPVVVMSGYDDMKKSIEALRLGAFDYLTKPIRLEQLYASLGKLESLLKNRQKIYDLLPHVQGEIRVEIPSRLRYVESVVAYARNQIEPACHAHGINIFNISLCLQEALTNAIIHGNLEIPSEIKDASWEDFEQERQNRESDPAYGDRSVLIFIKFDSDGIIFEVEDEGPGFDRSEMPDFQDPGNLLSFGRGIFYIMTFMDGVEWSDSGNRILMRKKFPSGEEF